MALVCRNPLKLHKFAEAFGRCGVCPDCVKMKQIEWANRMCLESYGKAFRPLFLTMTYDNAHLPSNRSECVKFCQRFIKKLRKKGLSVRYFLATENGSRGGRLHQHMVVWIKEIAHLNPYLKWELLYETWGAGRLEAQEIRSPGAFFYTAKYIVKNITEKKPGSVWSRREGQYIDAGRLYTWSNKPALGTDGIDRWKYLTEKMYVEGIPPPGWFNMMLLGKLRKVYIPRQTYVKHVQKTLGLNLNKHIKVFKGRAADINIKEIDQEILSWQEKNEDQLVIKI